MEVVPTVTMAVHQLIHHVLAVVLPVHAQIALVVAPHHPIKLDQDQRIRDNKLGQQERNVLVLLYLRHQLVREVDRIVITVHGQLVLETENKLIHHETIFINTLIHGPKPCFACAICGRCLALFANTTWFYS